MINADQRGMLLHQNFKLSISAPFVITSIESCTMDELKRVFPVLWQCPAVLNHLCSALGSKNMDTMCLELDKL